MTRARVLILGAAGALIVGGVLLIPSGGGANTANSTQFYGEMLQNGATVSAVTVKNCTGGATTGVPKWSLSAKATSTTATGTSYGNTGNGDNIRVYYGSTLLGTISDFGTTVPLEGPASLPCSGTARFDFKPYKANGSAASSGARDFTKTVNITGVAS